MKTDEELQISTVYLILLHFFRVYLLPPYFSMCIGISEKFFNLQADMISVCTFVDES